MPTVNPVLADVMPIFVTRSTVSVIHTSIPGHDTFATSSFKTTAFIFAMSVFLAYNNSRTAEWIADSTCCLKIVRRVQ